MTTLPKTVTRRQKRVGRGYGSGKGGHTASRGQKGQKSRGDVHILFEGVKVRKSLLSRLPMWRGKGKFLPQKGPVILNLADLNAFKAGEKVTLEALVKKGLLAKKDMARGVKILSSGKLEKKIEVGVPVSKKASEKIGKVGGKLIE